jgi:hypothetical protein
MVPSHRACLRAGSRWAHALLLSLVAGAPLRAAAPGAGAGLSEDEARAEFHAICESLKHGDNGFFSDQSVVGLEAMLPAVAGFPVKEADVLGRLAKEKLKLADPRRAIELFDQALLRIAGHEAEAPQGMVASFEWYLALSWLGYAEDQNCIAHSGARSCVLPVKGSGIHTMPDAARRAGDLFLAYARKHAGSHPTDIQARWLLNVARQLSGDWPEGVPADLRLPDDAFATAIEFPEWPNRAPELGVAVVDLAGGAGMEDYDGDGFLDLVSTTWNPCESMKAFRNDRKGGFEDVAEKWGLASQFGGLNMMHADYDNDGDVDILVLRGAWMYDSGKIRKSLLRNDLDGPARRFVDVTTAAGLGGSVYPTQAASFQDYDADGDLDLYVGAEAAGKNFFASQLFRNNGDGTFADVAKQAGVENVRFAKAVAWGDYDEDADPDLFVSDFGENRFYRNNGDGTFTDIAPELGLKKPAPETFPTWFFDFDNDGDLDLFVADYRQQAARVSASYFGEVFPDGNPMLWRNDGGRFVEVSRELGITRPAMPMGSNYGDLDNDGWLDFYLGTGEPDLASLQPNQMYKNDHGRRFVEVTFAGGFGALPKGHGVAFGDLDNDGDQDLFHQLGGFFPGDEAASALFENPGPAGNWVTLRLEGRRANRYGIGGRIEAQITERGERRSVHVLVGSGGSFGASSLEQEIGLGAATRIDRLIVRWPRPGETRTYEDVAVNRVYRVVEGEPALRPIEVARLHLGTTSGG